MWKIAKRKNKLWRGETEKVSSTMALVEEAEARALRWRKEIQWDVDQGQCRKDLQLQESILNIKYGIHGDRAAGAHKPVDANHSETETERRDLVFKSAIVLQRPVLDPCLTVGFLPLASDGLRAGKLITMQWRVERLKDLKESEAVERQHDEVLYEVYANSENWMIAGKKRGHVSLSEEQGSRVVISILCVPLVAGYVRPPQVGLPNVEEANVSNNPPGPHLVCVLPPLLSSSYCVPVK
ncbi:hypothetical protein EUTSA_v10015732mg [Eutrema salsugineum]|uniref:TRAPPC10/Trs130 C-terminal domain-containing protein n=1 Tax=Eutrema salsugineum TaxID=72664 RepID=V4LKS7_EUTSA|nr:hypothetical protein EUTSA_v10015732mg [Eutrema salsugineum]